MQRIGDRIRLLCSVLELSKRKFAEKVNIKASTLSSIVNGSSPSSDIISAVVNNYPELNERWLLIGEGPIWKKDLWQSFGVAEQKELDALNEQIKIKSEIIEALKGQVNALERTVSLLEKQMNLLEGEISKRDETKKVS